MQGQGARAGTDSDVGGGDVTLRVGLGTGAGTPAQLHLQGSKTSPTATNLQVAIRRSSYNLSKALTSGLATTPFGLYTRIPGVAPLKTAKLFIVWGSFHQLRCPRNWSTI